MGDLELIVTTSATLVTGGVAPIIVGHVKRRWDLTIKAEAITSGALHTTMFVCLMLFYRHAVEPAGVWQKTFHPDVMRVEGDYLQVKSPDVDSPLAADDLERYPFSLLTIQYDSHDGRWTLDGVTASRDDEVYFRSTGIISDDAGREMAFEFQAQVGPELVRGLIAINFHPEDGDRFREASGYFVDARGYRVNFRLRRVDVGPHDLRSASSRVRYLRDLSDRQKSRSPS